MPKKRSAAKKTTSRKPTKLPPSKTFAVHSVSRREVAAALNNAIEGQRSRVKRFKPDDPRLTDAVCEAFAWSVSDHVDQSLDHLLEDALKDVASDELEELEDALETP